MKKTKIIWGAGGTGKSYSLAKYLIEKEQDDELFSFLITSYTHTGKNEIYRKYLELKGEDFNFYHNQNFPECKTFHSLIYQILKTYATKKKGTKKIIDFLKMEEEEEDLSPLANSLFFQNFENKKALLQHNFNNLSKVLDISLDRIGKLISIYDLLKKVSEGDEETNHTSLIDKIKKELFSLKSSEIVAILLLLEGNLYDFGYIYDPFKQTYVDSKFNYIIKKYNFIFELSIVDELKEALEYVLSEDFNSPLHPIYNMRKLYDWLKKNNFKELYHYKVIIIDEAQDFPEVAYRLIRDFFDYDELILAGDPYQAIFLDLGYNSEFMDINRVNEIKSTLYRYTKEYLYLVKNILKKNIFVLDSITSFKNTTNTKLEIRESSSITDILYFDKLVKTNFFDNLKNKYYKAGLSIISAIRNKTDSVFLTHNLSKFSNVSGIVLLPYKGVLQIKNISKLYTYLLAKYILYKGNNDTNAKLILDKLLSYYRLNENLDLSPMIETISFKKLREKIKYIDSDIKKILNKEKKLSFESLYHVIRKDKDLLESFKTLGKKDFVVALTTHKSKGKTIDETIYYLPNMGLYYYMLKEDPNYFFIHDMLKYVSLTRASRKLVYVIPSNNS